jgi:CYTH domain-containing protein
MIENELKFIVRYSTELEASLKRKYGWVLIDQAYLNGRARVRRKTTLTEDQWFFTFKQRLENGHNIEIETEISEQDYNALLPFAPDRFIKQRVTVRRDDVCWDIDFPYWARGNHFIVAEAEMPATMDQPPVILEDIKSHIAFAVPRSDGRFNARRLIDEKHAMALAEELGLYGDPKPQPLQDRMLPF